jgi:broad specificity phosphatase PhoE
MPTVYYISHPEVIIDPTIPVPQWDLSELGQQRLEKLLEQPWLVEIQAVYCSQEQKALTTARRIAEFLRIETIAYAELGEIDRSATGYLPRAELEPVVAALFSRPTESICGWERAWDAQQRTITIIEEILTHLAPAHVDVIIVGHGGVGTLYLNHIEGDEINRQESAPGQGYYYAFDRQTRKLLHSWQPIDLIIEH